MLTACSKEKTDSVPESVGGTGYWKHSVIDNAETETNLYFDNGLEVILPLEWSGKIVTSIEGNTMLFCEKENAQESAGGVLFSLSYINGITFSDSKQYEVYEKMESVLGIYKESDNIECALVLSLPRDMNYVEQNEEMKKLYDDAYSFVDQVHVITDNMKDFVPLTVEDIAWITYAR